MWERGQGHSRAMAWLVSLSFTEMYIVGIVVVPEIVVGARGVRGRRGVWVWIGPISTIAMCYPKEQLGDGAESASEKGRCRWCQ
jgi:hypothetical protein